MDDGDTKAGNPAKRADVGYRRPPREHQFKKGHKPPPRKKKGQAAEVRMDQILRKVLHEPRRILISGKPKWVSGAELVILQAYQQAEKGNRMLRRELAKLLLSLDARASHDGPEVVTDPSAPEHATALRLMPVDPADDDQ